MNMQSNILPAVQLYLISGNNIISYAIDQRIIIIKVCTHCVFSQLVYVHAGR